MRIYIVGGALRDELMGRAVHDCDYVVLHAGHGEFMHHFPRARRVGGAFSVYISGGCEYTLSEAHSIEEDLEMRDLTVNAMAREVPLPGEGESVLRKPFGKGPVVAHPLALRDIGERVLRPVAVENFASDPCRTVRAARFAATLPGFTAGPGLFEAMEKGVSYGLANVAAERIGHELRKACAGPAPARFLGFLGRGGCFTDKAGWFLPFADDAELAPRASSLMQSMAAQLQRRRSALHPLPYKPDGAAMGVYMAMCRHMAPEDAFDFGNRLKLPGAWTRAGRDAAALLAGLGEYESLPPRDKLWLLLHLERNRLRGLATLLARAQYGIDVARRLNEDTRKVLAVRLPPKDQGKGRASGRTLARLRLRALER